MIWAVLFFAGAWALMAIATKPLIRRRPARDPVRLIWGGVMLGLVAAAAVCAMAWMLGA